MRTRSKQIVAEVIGTSVTQRPVEKFHYIVRARPPATGDAMAHVFDIMPDSISFQRAASSITAKRQKSHVMEQIVVLKCSVDTVDRKVCSRLSPFDLRLRTDRILLSLFQLGYIYLAKVSRYCDLCYFHL